MQLYFQPLACSLASRIVLYEAGAEAMFTEIDTKAKRTLDGDDFLTVNPLGLVPVLRTDEGDLLTENAAVLQFIADQHHAAGLAPLGGLGRARLQQWLCFIGTELHKALFVVLLDPKQGDAARARAREIGASRLAYLDAHLAGRDYLLDAFTVADAYLVTVLNWSRATAVDLTPYPAVKAYFERLQARPSVARAMGEEFELYRAEQARRAAA